MVSISARMAPVTSRQNRFLGLRELGEQALIDPPRRIAGPLGQQVQRLGDQFGAHARFRSLAHACL
jgi:hypothetical protein